MSNDFDGAVAGLAVVIGSGAIVIGYLVSLAVPKSHYPATAGSGLLASNAFIGCLAVAGIVVAGYMVVPWAVMSFAVGLRITLESDEKKSS